MSNVIIDKTKLDALAVSVAEKSGESVPLTIEEMRVAVNGISGGSANLQTKSETYTPTTSQQTDTITPDVGYDGMDEVDITINAVPTANTIWAYDDSTAFMGISVNEGGLITATYDRLTWGDIDLDASGYVVAENGKIPNSSINISAYKTSQLSTQSASAITPTESSQTAVAKGKWTTGAVTVNAIPSNYVGSGITQRSSSDLSASNLTVNVPSGHYANNSSKTLTDANLSAQNIKKDVSIFGVTGSYEGEGGGLKVKTATATPVSASSSISFSVDAEPTSFVICSSANLSTGASPYKTASVVFDGTNIFGQYITNSSNANVTYNGSGFSKSYNNGTLTVTGTGTNFQANEYTLVYTYGGSADTKDVQVGSGATSIAFTDLEDEPSYFSCVFKSNFGTSSGYQRVISVVYDGTDTYGLAMDSSAKAQTTWTYTYNNGTLTISSNGTNSGGYFHQPGYYQLTYAVGGSGNYQTKTVTNDDNTATSISFTSLKGTPKYWFLRLTSQVSSSGSTTYYYVVDMRYNGTNTTGNCFRMGSTRRVDNVTSGYSYTYTGTTLTISSSGSRTASPGSFYNGGYELVYIY